MTRIVNDGKYVNQNFLDRVKDAIWKSWQECAAHARDNFCVQKWNLFKPFKLKFKSQLKLGTQSFALFLVPIERFANLLNCATSKLQAVRHEPLFKCALT